MKRANERYITLKLQAISKPAYKKNCHSERSEESRFFNGLRSFTSFRMTEKYGFEMACNVSEEA